MTRDEILLLSDEELVRLCRVDTFRGTGPGGQKRNKTESAVRVTHRESGLAAFDDQSRSQHLNRARALQKLRLELAANLRQPPQPWDKDCPGLNSRLFLLAGGSFDALTSPPSSVTRGLCWVPSTGEAKPEIYARPFACQRVSTRNRQKRDCRR